MQIWQTVISLTAVVVSLGCYLVGLLLIITRVRGAGRTLGVIAMVVLAVTAVGTVAYLRYLPLLASRLEMSSALTVGVGSLFWAVVGAVGPVLLALAAVAVTTRSTADTGSPGGTPWRQ